MDGYGIHGAFLTPHDQPGRVLYRSQTPIFEPEAVYETDGFFKNVVFTCGIICAGDTLRMYYGASDDTVGMAEVQIDEILASLNAL